jgi:hypothetical protein
MSAGVRPRPLRSPEVVANLWAYADEGGYIARIAGRAYVLDGDDDVKLAVLKQLAATDFLHAEWQPVPKRFAVVNSEGERMEGVAHASMLNDGVTPGHLFGPLLDKLSAGVPEQMRSIDGEYQRFCLKMSDDPLTVTTVIVEREDGSLIPHTSST